MTPKRAFHECYSEAPSGCWLWNRATTGRGYGSYARQPAHRFSWEKHAEEPIPEGIFVCHKCDVKNCVNPRHLFLGTPKDNMQDMIRKGRRVMGDPTKRQRGEDWKSSHAGLNPKGEAHAMAKLSEGIVLSIRANTDSTSAVARKYGISRKTVDQIRLRQTWRHLP